MPKAASAAQFAGSEMCIRDSERAALDGPQDDLHLLAEDDTRLVHQELERQDLRQGGPRRKQQHAEHGGTCPRQRAGKRDDKAREDRVHRSLRNRSRFGLGSKEARNVTRLLQISHPCRLPEDKTAGHG